MRVRWLAVLGVCATLVAADGGLRLGADAPRFTLNDLGGKAHQLAAHKGQAKAVVLIWVSTQCRSGIAYQQRIQALHQEFRNRGVVVYGISSNQGEPGTEVRRYMHAHKLTYPVLKDPHNKVADAYQAVCTTEVFVLDGQLKLRYHGAFDNHREPAKVDPAKRYARNAVLAVLQGRSPTPAQTPPAGCAIDRE